MSKDKKNSTTPALEVVASPAAVPAPPPAPAAPNERLQEVDRLALELAKQRRLTSIAEARNAVSQSENAELAYKYVVLQLYMKYGLSEADAISEAGEILRGGALARPQGQ